jgi:hypothetical protein
MSKFKALFAIALLFLFVATPVRAAQDTIRIGAAFALSGSIAVYGEGFRKCVDLAVDEINAKGGIKGKKIQIIYEDNKSTPKDCVTASEVITSTGSRPLRTRREFQIMAAAPVASRARRSGLAQGRRRSDPGRPFFRIIPSTRSRVSAAKWPSPGVQEAARHVRQQ